MNRRQFGAAMAALGLTQNTYAASSKEVETVHLSRNGWCRTMNDCPSCSTAGAFSGAELTDRMELTFQNNLWPAQWRNGVYTFHHYHSTAHEIVGIAAGGAHLVLGGEGGHEVIVVTGDVLVLPTGTGHYLAKAEPGFLVIGAYPVGQHWDICRAAPDPEGVERMRHLPFPAMDPVTGRNGELVRRWKAT